MIRTFFIKEEGKPEVEYSGSFSYGRLNALRDYARDNLPGWTVLSGGQLVANQGGFVWWSAEAINADQTRGTRLWVKEPY
jgi:hypothetical protein